MKINTAYFGEVEIDESSVIHFEEGIPGFEDVKKYVMLNDTTNSAFQWLQAVDQPAPAFAVLNPFSVKADYEFEIDSKTKESLSLSDGNDIAVCAIANVPSTITKMSVNLKAPVIINTAAKKGRQMILQNSAYEVKHSILGEIIGTAFSAAATAAATAEEK